MGRESSSEFNPRDGEELLMTTFLVNLVRDEQGQDLIEYTLLLAFVALASAALFISSGQSVSSIWGTASDNLASAAITAS